MRNSASDAVLAKDLAMVLTAYGFTTEKIADGLNALGITTAQGKAWTSENLRARKHYRKKKGL